ncbi:hypothetical protein EXIGLDRAFT_607803 [Exidia glandulosa HHB12029]|uniref:Uncharacterized protein n=1 Tax=Exidia glandulosa HHB12029 TaxID=1314781 RepID=A0A165LC73_EXIGL|nr:hypothetical protein EXIGLDRAFT_607803 [Exidia glandulosa HHB12029]
MGGPIFDTYRAVYDYMTYCVRLEGQYSDLFTSDMGVLIGDPASPIMWLLYFADVSIPESVDDILLNETRISHLEQADDIVIFATTAEGLQRKLDAFFEWCCRNLLKINGSKSWWMPLGSRPIDIPVFRVNNEVVPIEEKKMYVGMLLTSSLARDQRAHVAQKVEKAHRISCLTFGILDRKCLEVPPRPARKLYMGLVDPHMTHGCEVMPDATLCGTEQLERVQKTYIRKMLRVGPKVCVVPLYTETGLSPIRFRRADLAVRFLGYALQQKEGDLVGCAVRDSRALALAGKKSWLGDLRKACQHLHGGGVDIGFPDSADGIDDVRSALKECEKRYLRTATESCGKLPLLTGRLHENCFAQAAPRPAPVTAFRSYLKIRAREHRTALTRFLFSDHMLAVERLRYENVPRARRKCRFCRDAVEDELHALFECDGHEELNGFRLSLLDDVRRVKGEGAVIRLLERPLEDVFQMLLADGDTVSALARCVHRVLRCFESIPILRG